MRVCVCVCVCVCLLSTYGATVRLAGAAAVTVRFVLERAVFAARPVVRLAIRDVHKAGRAGAPGAPANEVVGFFWARAAFAPR